MSALSQEDRKWLYRLLRKESKEAHDAARRLRTTNPSGGLTRRGLDILAEAHEQAAKPYDRAINFHCEDLARDELLRKLEKR